MLKQTEDKVVEELINGVQPYIVSKKYNILEQEVYRLVELHKKDINSTLIDRLSEKNINGINDIDSLMTTQELKAIALKTNSYEIMNKIMQRFDTRLDTKSTSLNEEISMQKAISSSFKDVFNDKGVNLTTNVGVSTQNVNSLFNSLKDK